MKGIVFTELIEMVEAELGLDIADRMLENAAMEHRGAYTAVGTYDHRELLQLVRCLSKETNLPVPDLVRTFGKHLFTRFTQLYPAFFENCSSAVEFLPRVESYIHVEVRKLYPEAELPSFESSVDEYNLQITYRSSRPFADLAEGLILASIDHFGEPTDLKREDLGIRDGTVARFTLTPAVQPCAS